jgi:hypothetical protein
VQLYEREVMDMNFKTNFNNVVKVKLTQLGREIVQKKHDEDRDLLLKYKSRTRLGDFVIITDDQGYTSFQIYELMNIFGEQMVIGADEPFTDEMIFMNATQYDVGGD